MAKKIEEGSLIEIAKAIVDKKACSLQDLIKKACKEKGKEETPELIAQLYQDIMVNGAFILYMEGGKMMVDLKSHKSFDFVSKENAGIGDLHADDAEVKDNELSDDSSAMVDEFGNALDQMNQDEQEEEEKNETDELAEAFGLVDADSTSEDEIYVDDDEEEDEEEEQEDLEDVQGEARF